METMIPVASAASSPNRRVHMSSEGLPMNALLRSMLFAACVMAASSVQAPAQGFGDPAAGRVIAAAECAQCHRILERDNDPNRTPPDFGAVANMPSFTELSMRVFLQTPHGQMPRLQFTRTELDDIIAYLASLRRR
jgi:mono/diheme cytochrome c family protein